ncbi:MAG: ribonuclease E/G, partial [Mycobacterium sp.]
MTDGGPFSEVSEHSSQHEELPDRLRVHSLARALGTTSRQVLDALTELDGRIRSAHSTVERVDAVRVRDLLAGTPTTVAAPIGAGQADAAVEADEPESRLMLETPDTPADRPEYMPLFVAPQPVARVEVQEDTEDADDSDDDDGEDFDGDDDDQSERPANRRRRRG